MKKQYAYSYRTWRVSNETLADVNVHFDDLKITHRKGNIVQVDDYYPFGLTFNSYQRPTSKVNKYLYGGKELQTDLDLGWVDFGARMYDASIGRWNHIDPLSGMYLRWSPYNYTMNNPILFVDPNGMSVEEINGGVKLTGRHARKAFKALQGKNGGKKKKKKKNKKVAIDPGHGDHHKTNGQIDPGAGANGFKEKDLALKVSNSVSERLGQLGVDNMMTRTDDIKTDGRRISWRLKQATDTDIFVSIHLNAVDGNESANGFVVLYQEGADKGEQLAIAIADTQTIMRLKGRGKAIGTKSRPASGRLSLGVLRNYGGEASVLVELGFITNSNDANTINNQSRQIGHEIANGIYKYIYGTAPSNKIVPVSSELQGHN